jgi:predicted enzyme related to lactoylglutathione lyase
VQQHGRLFDLPKDANMDAFQTPGAVSWTELTTTDPAGAAAFYGALFGWNIKPPDAAMGGYRVVQVGEAMLGGITGCPEGTPQAASWGSYVTVSDVAATVAKCEALGGRCVLAPMDVPNVGRMAVILDPQGAALNVIQYNPM